jgi:psp operon transcriptional activator
LERVGGSTTLALDVRLIGATHRDLPQEAHAGHFRNDLLDRLAFEVLTIPPLRARRDDIPLLAEHFGRAISHELGWGGFPGFASQTLEGLAKHDWPGNVRELKNVVERAVYRALSPSQPIAAFMLDPFESPYRPRTQHEERAATPQVQLDRKTIPDASRPLDFRADVADFERQLLEQALTANQHNQRNAARHLNLSYDQLRHQLKKHGLSGNADRHGS